MPTRNYPGVSVSADGLVLRQDVGSITWTNSPKVKGKLVLRANILNQSRLWRRGGFQESFIMNGKRRYASSALTGASWLKGNGGTWPTGVPAGLTNIAHQRFLNLTQSKQKASLGVTLASYRQTTSMLAQRTAHASMLADKRIRVLKSRRGKKETRRRLAQLRRKYGPNYDPASLYLEGIFGWAPLFQDISDGMATLIGLNAYESRFIRASASSSREWESFRYNYNGGTDRNPGRVGQIRDFINCTTKYRVTESAKVTVDNPNLHMANRLGALNLLKVGWDVVPWSFVVNMFVNVNQMLDNCSAFAGLKVENASVTRTAFTTFHGQWQVWEDTSKGRRTMSVGAYQNYVSKARTLGTASFTWQLSLPNADLSLAATATALLEQKFRVITKLVRALRK